MAKKKFQLISTVPAVDENDWAIKQYYNNWRNYNRLGKQPFIALDNSFKDKHLKTLEPGPLRLYLFFAFAANNETGHSWHSIQSIAGFFGAQTRTIDNWIKTLVEKDLIHREQKGHRSHTTYLLPYSDTLIKHQPIKQIENDSQELLDDLINRIKKFQKIYGQIIKVFHLFQWRNKKGKPDKSSSTQMLLIITKRSNGVLIGHLYTLVNSNDLSVHELNIEAVSFFNSHFEYNNSTVPGLALPHDIPLKRRGSVGAVLELLKDLERVEEWQLTDYPKLQYGEKEVVLIEEDEEGDGT